MWGSQQSSDKTDTKTEAINTDKEKHYMILKNQYKKILYSSTYMYSTQEHPKYIKQMLTDVKWETL